MEEIPTLIQASPTAGNDSPLAELLKIQTDASHPMHAGFHRNDPEAISYIKGLYEKRYGNGAIQLGPSTAFTEPAEASTVSSPTGLSPEERVAQAEVDTFLRQTLGEEYDSEMRDMRMGSAHLFASPDGVKLLDHIAPVISGLGPQAEVLGIRFLAQLGRLAHTHTGGSR